MKRGLIWGGFGALLLVGVLSGYAPDFMLASALRGARAEGLLTTPSRIEPKLDARPAYEAAATKYADGWNLLGNDFARQVKTPAPHVVKYLDAMAEASKLPRCSPLHNDWDGRYYGRSETDLLAKAASALVARAKDEASLSAGARIAAHLGAQSGPLPVGYWASLVPKALDRAKALGLTPGSFVVALGPPLDPREALRRHVSAEVEAFDATTRKSGGSATRTREEMSYLRFWRGFLAKNPSGSGFVDSLRKAEAEISNAENGSGEGYVDISAVTGSSPNRWAAWATLLEKADERLAARG